MQLSTTRVSRGVAWNYPLYDQGTLDLRELVTPKVKIGRGVALPGWGVSCASTTIHYYRSVRGRSNIGYKRAWLRQGRNTIEALQDAIVAPHLTSYARVSCLWLLHASSRCICFPPMSLRSQRRLCLRVFLHTAYKELYGACWIGERQHRHASRVRTATRARARRVRGRATRAMPAVVALCLVEVNI